MSIGSLSESAHKPSGEFDYFAGQLQLESLAPPELSTSESSEKFDFYASKKRFLATAIYVILSIYEVYLVSCSSPLSLGVTVYANSTNSTNSSTYWWETVRWDVNNMGVLFFFCCVAFPVPAACLLRKSTVRVFLVTSSSVITVSSFIRWVSIYCNVDTAYAIVYITQSVDAVAVQFTIVCPGLITVQWFPMNERRKATGVLVLSMYAGFAIAQLAGLSIEDNVNVDYALDVLLIQFIVCGTFAVLTFIFFPYPPKQPPNLVALTQKESSAMGLKRIVRKKSFWVVLSLPCLVVGPFTIMFFELQWVFINLKLELKSMVVGISLFASYFVGLLVALAIVSILADRFSLVFWLICILMCCLDLFFGISTIIGLTFSSISRYDATIFVPIFIFLAGICAMCIAALSIDFLIDATYPAPESIVYAVFVSAANLVPFFVLLRWVYWWRDYDDVAISLLVFTCVCLFVTTLLLPLLHRVRSYRTRLERAAHPSNTIAPMLN